MQKLLLIATIAVSSMTVSAQNPFTEKFKPDNYRSMVPAKVQEHLKSQASSKYRSANKTTGIMWRIAAYSSYENRGNGLAIVDSSKYVFSKGRGSEFDYEEMYIYDSGIDNPINSDSTYTYSDNGSGFEPSERYTSLYNTNNNRTTFIVEDYTLGTFVFNELYDVVYNSNGDVTTEYYIEWNSGNNNWDTTSIEYYTYDSQNYLVKDSLYDFFYNQPEYVFHFTNDMNGNMVKSVGLGWNSNTSTLDTQVIFNRGYYPNNQLKVDTFYYIDSGKVVYSYIDSFGYNNTDFHVFNETRILDTNTMSYYSDFREIRTLNSLNLPATQQYTSYDTITSTWEPVADAEWEYTSFGEPSLGTGYQYTNGTRDINPVGVYHIYYEHFFPANIQHITTGGFSVYPNPTKDQINIKAETNIQKAILYNIKGQIVSETALNNVRSARIDISGFTAGNYFLVLDQTNGISLKKQVVITD